MEGPLHAFDIKAVSLDGHSGIVDQDVDGVVLLLEHLQKGVDAFGVGDIQLLEVNAGCGVFGNDLSPGLLS